MSSVCVNYEGSEPFIALESFPEEHDHLGGPWQGFVTAREIGRCGLELNHIVSLGQVPGAITYRLVEYPRHSIYEELEVLGAM
jgi:hypothetical protein